jgi:CheY-like chemotaxis protein
MKILMVDDEPLICESMRMMLELDGHEMDEAYSGSEALEKLDHREFDLIFTDFFMPSMRGDQLAREVRGRNAQPPVVMLTGFPPNPAPEEVAKVVLKPFDLHSIRSVLRDFERTRRSQHLRTSRENRTARPVLALSRRDEGNQAPR